MDQKKKLLLVEDEELLRFLYDRQLGLAGFVVEAVGTGEETVSSLRQNTYDLVLLDLMLPDTNGIDILRQLQAENIHTKSPVVLLTNLSDEAVLQQGYELGIKGHIIKAQFTPEQIIEKVCAYTSTPAQQTTA